MRELLHGTEQTMAFQHVSFFGVSFRVLKEDLNSGPTVVTFASAFSFAWLPYTIPLRRNVNVQIIDENQGN